MVRKFPVSRVSRLALAALIAAGSVSALPTIALAKKEKEEAAKSSAFSPEFAKSAAPIEKEVTAVADSAEIKAATAKALSVQSDKAAFDAATAEIEAKLGDLPARVSALQPLATTPADKNMLGLWLYRLGSTRADPVMQNKGLVLMLDSGLVAAEQTGLIQFLAGQTAYVNGDYPAALKYLKPAYDSGYRDKQGMIQALLIDGYKRTGDTAASMALVMADIEAAKAKGVPPSESALRSALQTAYDAKQLAQTAELGAMLAQYYPSPDTWYQVIEVVRQLASLPNAENLDLMRLMETSGALTRKRDYGEYIANADPRAFPGEVVRVIDEGRSAGHLAASDYGADRADAATRAATDKASLPAQEADASKPAAKPAVVVAAGDVFLSYEEPAKAEAFYTRALGLPGVDANKVSLRLGMSQVKLGKYGDAVANFAKVTGSRAPVARLWTAYAKQKMGG